MTEPEPMTYRDLLPDFARLEPDDPMWDRLIVGTFPPPAPPDEYVSPLPNLWALVAQKRAEIDALTDEVWPHWRVTDRRLRSRLLRIDRRAARRSRRHR